eukprot:CAMPEP_0194053156 /NCGR_PEP_ID=MMETSP0009_2-20130614/48490_1 /TAXON_ID=210454 /ORGANISM="Grammatophora oceanica, Strain CCMP 410" /LENGTH=32 /DNA_ID= /DNA_START= /DNA_END= /DNA_ORIENTATION=
MEGKPLRAVEGGEQKRAAERGENGGGPPAHAG